MRLELVKLAAIDNPRDHFVHVVGRADVFRHQRVKLLGRIERRLHRLERQAVGVARAEVADNVADQAQRMFVIVGQVIDHA